MTLSPTPPAVPPAPPQGPGVPQPFPAAPALPPAPPQGPGVQPPFPAPPVEGRGRRRLTFIWVGIGTFLLVAGGGLAAVIGIFSVGSQALSERADVAVSHYLDAVGEKRYNDAYDMLCASAQAQQSEDTFIDRVSGEQPIARYDVGDLDFVRLSVPVDVRYADGSSGQLRAYLEQNRSTGAFEVCSIEE